MSKERALLKRLAEKDMVQYYYGSLVNEIKELLAQPEQEQEAVDWQYRTTQNWREQWSKWESCGKNTYEDYKRVPQLHDWLYETRELYTSPPTREPLSDEEIILAYRGLVKRAIGRFQKTKPAHKKEEDDE